MYTEKDYSSLLGMEGFSEKLLTTHFGLYAGYVKNTNKVSELLGSLDKTSPEYAELNRRFGWEFNGMRLHELYFENMKKDAEDMDANTSLAAKMAEDFGSVDAWMEDFVATSKMRGIGWTILYYDKAAGRLFNTWINEHDLGHLAGATPLLILDVFEHAYVMDYGMDRGQYIDAFFNVVNWEEVNNRFENA